jgi:hypothetical protein
MLQRFFAPLGGLLNIQVGSARTIFLGGKIARENS